MPTWLAIAIPSVVAVAAILMWALDYSKKAHEIAKLRLELEKLRLESERSEREEQSRASGLYTLTAEELDRFMAESRRRHMSGYDEESYPRASHRPGYLKMVVVVVLTAIALSLLVSLVLYILR